MPAAAGTSAGTTLARTTVVERGSGTGTDVEPKQSGMKKIGSQNRLRLSLSSNEVADRMTDEVLKGNGGIGNPSARKRSGYLIDPRSSKFMGHWDVVGLMALVFTALVTPYEISFLEGGTVNPLFIVNRVVDMIFIVDLVLQFSLVYEDEMIKDASLRWITDRRKITIHYLKGWFSVDLVSCAVSSFDFVGLGAGDTISSGDRQLLQILRALRLIKLLRLVRLKRLFRRWEKRMSFNYGNFEIFKCVVYVLLCCHWCACIWTLQTVFVSDLMDSWRGSYGYCSLVPAEDESGGSEIVCASPGATWMASYYLMMMTITSVGYGDISATNTYEQVILTLLMLATSLMWSQVISTFCLVLANQGPANQEFYNAMDSLNTYMTLNAFPKSMRSHLRAYFHETRHLRLQRRHKLLYADMSPTLAARAFVEINERAMQSLWMIRECSSECRFRFVEGMQTRVYAPGEHTEADNLNIVQRGRALYRGELMKLHDAWGFDVIMIRDKFVRSTAAKALNYLEVSCIKRSDVLQVIANLTPSDQAVLRKCAARMAFCRFMVLKLQASKNAGLTAALAAAKLTTNPGTESMNTAFRGGSLQASPGLASPSAAAATPTITASAVSLTTAVDGSISPFRIDALEAKVDALHSSQQSILQLLLEMRAATHAPPASMADSFRGCAGFFAPATAPSTMTMAAPPMLWAASSASSVPASRRGDSLAA